MAKIFYKFPGEILSPDEAAVAKEAFTVPEGREFFHWSSSSTIDEEVTALNPGGEGVVINQSVTYYPVVKLESLYKDFATITVEGSRRVAYNYLNYHIGYGAFTDVDHGTYIEYFAQDDISNNIIQLAINAGGGLKFNYGGYDMVANDYVEFFIDLKKIPSGGAKGFTATSYFGDEYYLKVYWGKIESGSLFGDVLFFNCNIKRNGKIVTFAEAFGPGFEDFAIEGRLFD